jgi:hypothetical protein
MNNLHASMLVYFTPPVEAKFDLGSYQQAELNHSHN